MAAVEHKIRAKSGGVVSVHLFRSRAIKAMCTECMGWGEAHPRDCTDKHCPLYPFRGRVMLAYGKPEEDSETDDE